MRRPRRPVENAAAVRAALFASQNGLCALCGEPMPASRWDTPHASVWRKLQPTLDHVRAVSRGGSDAPDNLQLAHAACNRRKGAG